MRHRGPDDGGLYAAGPVALGHRRLSILDLSENGRQPMFSSDGNFVLVFNGEIYNYLELREELAARGSRFQSQTDTEVILEAYRHWGQDCVSRFNGMWAFALYDVRDRLVFFSRDRFGIKPFYYVLDGECLAFASEIKGVLTMRPRERAANLPYVARFLPGGALDDGAETCFANVRALLPGHNAIYRLDGTHFAIARYWRLDHAAEANAARERDAVEELRELLSSAVRLHMRSDVPVGSCLSGGIDSSTIVCLMSRDHPEPIRTFSGIYPDRGCNEETYVNAINRHVRTRPCLVRPEPHGDLVDDLATITWHQDEPTAGPGLYTQFHVMRHAAAQVKVILDGQGADELFAGYLFYLRPHLADMLGAPGATAKLRATALLLSAWRHWGAGSVPGGWDLVLGRWVGKVQRLLRRALPRRGRSPLPPVLHPSIDDRIRGAEILRDPPAPAGGELGTLLYSQVVSTSLPALLHYEDRNSMAFSIEARVPFLDHRLVELALRLPSHLKINGSWTKWALRKAAEPVLPAKVAWRRSKLGYPTPMARWLRQPRDREAAAAVLFSTSLARRELVHPDVLRQAWDEHQAGADHSWLLYRVLTTELWHRMYLDQWQPRPARPLPAVDRMASASRGTHEPAPAR
jgi:asparagine synthase (glutamine-hydrolysing)